MSDESTESKDSKAADAWGAGLLGALFDPGAIGISPDRRAEHEKRSRELERREDVEHEARMAFYTRNAEALDLDKAQIAKGDARYEEWVAYRDECREHMHRQTAALESIAKKLGGGQ